MLSSDQMRWLHVALPIALEQAHLKITVNEISERLEDVSQIPGQGGNIVFR
jgi:hypothetical protein